MGDNAEHRDGPLSGSSGDDSGAVDGPLAQADVKGPRTQFNARKPA